jgi:hypothetical protein
LEEGRICGDCEKQEVKYYTCSSIVAGRLRGFNH